MVQRTHALYAILALACLYLLADAFHLIDTDGLLESLRRPDSGPAGAIAWTPQRTQPATSEPVNLEQAREQLSTLMQNGDFGSLDRLCNSWQNEHAQTTDGWPALAAFQAIPAASAIRQDWRRALDGIQTWKAAATSDCATIVEAQLWYRVAWYERGNARWTELNDTAIRVFRDKLATARGLLEKDRDTLSDNPMWHALYMDLLTELGYGRESVLKVFTDALKLDTRYDPAYTAAAYAYFPQWGGSYRDMERFIQNSLRMVDETGAGPLYVHIYSTLDNDLDSDVDLFRDTNASWPLMKSGFVTLLKREPDNSLLLNQYASYACRAGDGTTYLEVRRHLEQDRIRKELWKHNHTPDTCDRTFMKSL